jgi:predicted nucleic acid-binding protein
VIVLDTNVISELMRAAPDPRVLAWATAQPRALLWTTHLNQAEILYGIAALPEGRRRAALAAAAEAMFAEDFAGRILPFGAAAAARYPGIVLARRRAGNPIEGFDALIAATALAAGAGVATRDTPGFAGCGLMLIDPWTAA